MEISLPQFHTQSLRPSVFNPISDFSLFSISHSLINQNLTLNLSLHSLYSQSQVSLVSTFHSIRSTIHTPFQTLAVAIDASSPHPLLRLTFHHGLSLLMLSVSASQSQDSRLYFLPFSSVFFFILRYGFFSLFNLLKTYRSQM